MLSGIDQAFQKLAATGLKVIAARAGREDRSEQYQRIFTLG